MENKEFVCHGGYRDVVGVTGQPCPAGPCKSTVKSNFEPCFCLLFGDDGRHIPHWEESCDGQVIASDTDVNERAGTTISEAVIDAAQWLIDQEHTFMFSEDESKFEDERAEHVDRIRDNLTYTQLAALVLSLSLYSAEFKECLEHIQEMER